MYKFKIIEGISKEEQEKALEDFMKDKNLIDISFSCAPKKIRFKHGKSGMMTIDESILDGQVTEEYLYSCVVVYTLN